MSERVIIIGASHAGIQLAMSLRQLKYQGDILVITEEASLPYQRPPLSKGLLANKQTLEQIAIRPAAFYEKHQIVLRLDTKVVSIDKNAKTITLNDDSQLEYGHLALCTGARVRKLICEGADLNNIHYLRTDQDIRTIQKGLNKSSRVVLIGGGYIGLETAASLSQLGCQVTVLEMAPRVLERVTAEPVSQFFSELHQSQGVSIVTEQAVNKITEQNGTLTLHCQSGATFEADKIIVGIGVIPNVELAQGAGLAIDNGIVVDEFGQTADPFIVAAGDCTFHPNAFVGANVRLESVPNAMEQAKSAAASILGQQVAHHSLPWFWSDQYHIKLQIAGLNLGYDQAVTRGDTSVGSASFVCFYFKNGQLIAADCVNRPVEFMVVKKLLIEKKSVALENLIDESIDPKSWLN